MNERVRGLVPSPTLAINELSRELRAQGREIYSLGFGQSPFPVPPTLVEALKANAFQKDYLPVRGLPELRSAAANYIQRKQGLEVSEEDVLIGPGSKELMFLLQLVHEADLLLPSPSWVSYCPQATILGQQVFWIPTQSEGEWRLDPTILHDFCKTHLRRHALLVLNYPGNPTGVTYSDQALREIAEVARRHQLLVLSDEIYGELRFDGAHVSIGRYYPEGTIISTGLSKWCGAGGWRLGTFIFPPALQPLLKAMAAVASETYSTTSAPIQYAAVGAFLGDPSVEDSVIAVRRILRSLGFWIARQLRDVGVDVVEPEGAYYIFPNFSRHKDRLQGKSIPTSTEFCLKLLQETGVALLAGSSFGRHESELSARLAYVDFDGAPALEASLQLAPQSPIEESFLKAYCPRVMEGIERLLQWLG